MTWFFWAVMASLSAAALAECNRKFRLEPQLLNAWRSGFAAIFMALTIPLASWPGLTNIKFYTIAGLDGLVNAIGMMFLLGLAARKTGRVTSMMLPVAAIGAYATWWLIMPYDRPVLVDKPVQVICATFSLLIIFMSLQKIRANDNSWESFVMVLPVGLVFGVFDALTNWVLRGQESVYGLAIAFTFVSAIACAIGAILAAIPEPVGGRRISIFNRRMIWGGFWAGFWTACLYLGSTFSLSLAANPAYPGIILALTPVWLFIWNTLRRQTDDASPVPSFMIILAAIGLLLSTL